MTRGDASIRAVLDTNVLVSAFIRPRGPLAQVRKALETGFYKIVLSDVLIEELREVLARPRIKKLGGYTKAEVTEFLEWLDLIGDVIPGPFYAPAIFTADPDDDWILATAHQGEANVIVTGDKPLLALGFHEGIPIMTPAAFLLELRKLRG